MYPVQYAAEHVEHHSRLTSFFRYFTAIPAALLTILYMFAAHIVVIIAWFAIVFTGRYPEGMYDFVGGALRNLFRLNAYSHLVTDQYPPWNGTPDPAYPVQIGIAPALEHYSRAKAFFRIILAIPVMIIAYVFQLIASVGALCAWFVILFTGKMPEGLQNLIDMGLRYMTQAYAYYWLITETWPPLGEEQAAQTPPAPPVSPAPTAPVV
jgi:Domain of unknown function (DUF4389)